MVAANQQRVSDSPPPQNPKGPPDGIVKDFLKMVEINVLTVGLTISMLFHQYKDFKYQNGRGSKPPDPLKALCLRHLHILSFQN